MHPNKINKLVVSMAVGAALVSLYPANLNALTATSPYALSTPGSTDTVAAAGSPTPGGFADAIANVTGTPGDQLVAEEPQAIDIWLAKLEFKESGGNTQLKILDVNGKYSYGCLQFQEGTFRNYALKYGLISRSTPTEKVIYDCDLQKEIAKLMLAENFSNWRAWYNSSKSPSVGLPPKEVALTK